jgi:hypothetical protein
VREKEREGGKEGGREGEREDERERARRRATAGGVDDPQTRTGGRPHRLRKDT